MSNDPTDIQARIDRGLLIAAACELIGQPVRLVPGTTPNPKVTVPGDLPFIASLLPDGVSF